MQQIRERQKTTDDQSKKSRKKKRSIEKIERNASGPRFLENKEPLNMELAQSILDFPSPNVGSLEGSPSVVQDAQVTEEQPQKTPHVVNSNKSNVFRWDQRSTFSQLAGLKINEKILGILEQKDEPKQS